MTIGRDDLSKSETVTVAAIEGGVGALATASGASAITYAVLNLTYSGDNIVALSCRAMQSRCHTLYHSI